MNKLIWLSIFLLSSAQSFASERVYLGTGDINGIYYQIGGEFCRLATNSSLNYRCAVVPSSGSIDNLALLEAKQINFAMVQSDWAFQASHGQGIFSGKPIQGLRALFATHAEPFTLVVRADSNLHSIEDIKERKVNFGQIGSGTRQTAISVLNAMRLNIKDVQEVDVAAPGESLCRGGIDAFAMVSGHPNKTLVETSKHCSIRFLPIDGNILAAILANAPYYQKSQIPPRLYPGNLSAVTTFAAAAILVTSATTSDEQAYAITKGMLNEQTNFNKQTFAYANLFRLNRHRTGKVLPIEQHPGAIRYFNELKQSGKL
ncbi:TAXI family TRAP transporter solute-binding subunit [Aeromonas veronii]|uniref:TAXI family TRAP transporter solute-binding subunit n=1 Tax=Aeromonas veronii TaxID=654 RepID=UPI0031FD7CDB